MSEQDWMTPEEREFIEDIDPDVPETVSSLWLYGLVKGADARIRELEAQVKQNAPASLLQRLTARQVLGVFQKIHGGCDKCWIWKGQKGNGGYGRFYLDGRHIMAHRVVYELLRGPIPDGLCLDHLCRNRLCVNPKHLEPVTMRENLIRSDITLMSIASKKTHCKRGHALDGDNLFVSRDGARSCRTCIRMLRAKYRAEKRKFRALSRNEAQAKKEEPLTQECDQCGREYPASWDAGCFNPITGDDDCDGHIRPIPQEQAKKGVDGGE